jgi:tyrosyl-tRNA synthetase
MSFAPVDEQIRVLRRGVETILTEEELRAKLERSRRENRPLRVKQGFDPTAPDIHLGHTVGMQILRNFQDLGHTIVLIVGDTTALVGDPSGRSQTRPRLTRAEILSNAATYQEQFFKILDREGTEVRFNGEWFGAMAFERFLELTSRFTVAQILERDDFRKRFREETPIGLHELLYPVLQAYDSVEIRADVEIGATEQTFNLVAGRNLQKSFGQEPQIAMTCPVLAGLDGVRRMSKSLGNYVGVTEEPEQMYGKVMSIPDELLDSWTRLVARWDERSLDAALAEIARGGNPMDAKAKLAARIVTLYHGESAAKRATAHFDRVVRRKDVPEEVETRELAPWAERLGIVRLVKEVGLAPSTSEARRLVEAGAVAVDGERVSDPKAEIEASVGRELLLRVGKRNYLRVRVEAFRAGHGGAAEA